MKILTAEQMRAIDRRTIEAGIPGLILMENAGCRVVEFLEQTFTPLERQRVVVVCGKGNNGGDGLVIARQLWTRFRPAALHVLLASPGADFQGDAATNWAALGALGISSSLSVEPEMRLATIVVDALLGTGLRGPAEGRALELIRETNGGFPLAAIVSVDVPSGLHPEGESGARGVHGDAGRTENRAGSAAHLRSSRSGHGRVHRHPAPSSLKQSPRTG